MSCKVLGSLACINEAGAEPAQRSVLDRAITASLRSQLSNDIKYRS